MALIKLKLFQVICGIYFIKSKLESNFLTDVFFILYCYILDVGRNLYPSYTNDMVQKSVTGWLRHSVDRLQSQIQKQQNND
jgi:hypothetical protein